MFVNDSCDALTSFFHIYSSPAVWAREGWSRLLFLLDVVAGFLFVISHKLFYLILAELLIIICINSSLYCSRILRFDVFVVLSKGCCCSVSLLEIITTMTPVKVVIVICS